MEEADLRPLRASDEKDNFMLVCRLLIDGGTAILRSIFDSIHHPCTLPRILANPGIKNTIRQVKKERHLTGVQWKELYPKHGQFGKSEDFDISLLFILLRHICNLPEPKCGWDSAPPNDDLSREADLVRVRMYRNSIHAHASKGEIDDESFTVYVQTISDCFIRLGGQVWKTEIDNLLNSPLTTDAERCISELTTWYQLDTELKEEILNIKTEIKRHSEEVTYLFQAMSETDKKVSVVAKGVQEIRAHMNSKQILLKSIPSLARLHLLLSIVSSVILISWNLYVHADEMDDFKCTKTDQSASFTDAGDIQKAVCFDQIITNNFALFLTQFILEVLPIAAWVILQSKRLHLYFGYTSRTNRRLMQKEMKRLQSSAPLLTLHGSYMFLVLIRIMQCCICLILQYILNGFLVKSWYSCTVGSRSFDCYVPMAHARSGLLWFNIVFDLSKAIVLYVDLQTTYSLNKEVRHSNRGHSWLPALMSDYDFCEAYVSNTEVSEAWDPLLSTAEFDALVQHEEPGSDEENEPIVVYDDSEPEPVIRQRKGSNVLRQGYRLNVFGGPGNKEGEFRNPRGVAFDRTSGQVLVIDSTNHRIQIFDKSGYFVKSLGKQGVELGQFTSPRDLALNKDGRIVVADTENHRIQIVDLDGNAIDHIKDKGPAGRFNRPCGVTVDHKNKIIVADTYNHCIAVFESSGSLFVHFGHYGNRVGQFDHPYSADVDDDNNIYVPDFYNNRIQVVSPHGVFLRVFAQTFTFDRPSVVRFLTNHNTLIVAEWGQTPLQMFDASGEHKGSLGSKGSGFEQFNSPCGIICSPEGIIYISDTGNHRVYILEPRKLV